MFELAINFAEDTKIPYYQQLYSFIREEIESGRMVAGTHLPSIRNLSTRLNLSKTTVDAAYQQLIAEGYLTSTPRVGYFSLSPEEPLARPLVAMSPGARPLSHNAPTPVDIDFHPAQIDGMHFPQSVWKKLLSDVWKDVDNAWFHYGDPQGEWGLREQICRYLYHSRGVNSTPDRIIMGSGMPYAMYVLCHLLDTDPLIVGMEDPGYDKVKRLFDHHGIPILPIPLEADGLSVERLWHSKANLVYVTPSHQFPRGVVMSYTKRKQLLQWAHERHAYIIEDDYDGEFRYTERPIPSLQGLDVDDLVIYIGTFSKSLAPALRLNYMVLPHALIPRLVPFLQAHDSPVPRIMQIVTERFLEHGDWEKHLRRMRRIYRKKHDVLVEAIHTAMGDAPVLSGHGAGLHVSFTLKNARYNATDLINRAESVGVRVYTLAPTAETDQPTLILGFGGLNHEQIKEGIRRLCTVWF